MVHSYLFHFAGYITSTLKRLFIFMNSLEASVICIHQKVRHHNNRRNLPNLQISPVSDLMDFDQWTFHTIYLLVLFWIIRLQKLKIKQSWFSSAKIVKSLQSIGYNVREKLKQFRQQKLLFSTKMTFFPQLQPQKLQV